MDSLDLTPTDPQTLLALPKDKAEAVLNKLPLEEQASLILLAPWEKRHEIILMSHQSRELVRSMPVEELFWTIKAIGTQDAIHILGLATPEQLQFFLDLDLWYKDKLRPEKVAAWLLLLSETEPDALSAWILFNSSKDQWLIPAMLRLFITVQKRPDDMDIQEAKDVLPPFTIDNNYFIGFKKPELQSIAANLLYKLLEISPDLYRNVLETILTETPTENLEYAYNLRKARLSDWGIPDYYDSLDIYAKLMPDQVRKVDLTEPETTPEDMPAIPPFIPTLYMEDYPFLHSALQEIVGTTAMERVLWEWAGAANKLLMADLVDLDDPDVLKETLFKASALLNLGLEIMHHLYGDGAGTILKQSVIEDLVRVANTAVWSLVDRLKELINKAIIPADLSYIPEEYIDFLKGLLAERPGLPVSGKEKFKPFASVSELEKIQDILDIVETLAKAISAIPPEWKKWDYSIAWEQTNLLSPKPFSFDKALLTAFANKALGHGLVIAPLDEKELKKLRTLWDSESSFLSSISKELKELALKTDINPEILQKVMIKAFNQLAFEWQDIDESSLTGRDVTMILVDVHNES